MARSALEATIRSAEFEYNSIDGAWIHSRSRIHESVRIGPGAVIGPEVTIGEDCVIDAGAQLYSHTELGAGNRLWPGAILGGDPQDVNFDDREETWLRIGEGNVFREGVTIHRGSVKENRVTTIGDRNYFMAFSHIGHDSRVEDQCVFSNGVLIAGHCHVQSGANFGGDVAIAQFLTVGRLAFVGGTSSCRRDLEPFLIHNNTTVGNATRPLTVNKVGLERAGIPVDSIRQLRRVHRWLFSGGKRDVEAVRSRLGEAICPEVEELLEFITRVQAGRQGLQRKAP